MITTRTKNILTHGWMNNNSRVITIFTLGHWPNVFFVMLLKNIGNVSIRNCLDFEVSV